MKPISIPNGGGLIVLGQTGTAGLGISLNTTIMPMLRRTFLLKANARAIVIPYRANRAVIFNSNLFHQTDKMNFKEGYANRRINLTLLYGRR